MQLPVEFLKNTSRLFGSDLFERYLKALEEEVPVSIRLNKSVPVPKEASPIPWCRNGYYLPGRPAFTFDPLLHAGCYYVQEAASMFLDRVMQQYLPTLLSHQSPLSFLDLCAAPGGKSTLIFNALPEGSTLVSNEPNAKRAQILSENMQKWQADTLTTDKKTCVVTNNYPRDFRRSKLLFDAILCDVPCSGEGMFRKDPATTGEWSQQNVEKCWQLQREIVGDAWQCLRAGGLFVYSTCTFNTQENEENIRWMTEELDAEVLPVNIEPTWNITGSLLSGFTCPVYRFIPGLTLGEGLFLAVLRKKQDTPTEGRKIPSTSTLSSLHILPNYHLESLREALIQPYVDLSYIQAISYLRHEAIVLPADTPRGIVTVGYEGHRLGLAKNIGNRANNLYPKEWRIKSTHIPSTPPIIL